MVIDIDIRIADSKGKILHHFENQYNEKDSSFNRQENNIAGYDFEDFLAEYLSFSGFALREKLIKDSFSIPACQNQSEPETIPDIPEDDYDINKLKDSELEYRIRLGKNKVLIGKIPLKIQSENCNLSQSDIDDADIKLKTSKEDKRNNVNIEKMNPSTGLFKIKKVPLHSDEAEIDTILNYAMVKAIEKYEANLSPTLSEADYNFEPAFEE